MGETYPRFSHWCTTACTSNTIYGKMVTQYTHAYLLEKLYRGVYPIFPCMHSTVTDLLSLTVIIDALSTFPTSTRGIFPQWPQSRVHDQTIISVLLFPKKTESGLSCHRWSPQNGSPRTICGKLCCHGWSPGPSTAAIDGPPGPSVAP